MVAVLHTWTRAMNTIPTSICSFRAALTTTASGDRRAKSFSYRSRHSSASLLGHLHEARSKGATRGNLFPGGLNKDWIVFAANFQENKQSADLPLPLCLPGRHCQQQHHCPENNQVTFRYQDADTRQWKTMTLPAMEFLRRFLQHVLPKGFHKVRYYGFLHPANKKTLRRLQLLLWERDRTRADAAEQNIAFTN